MKHAKLVVGCLLLLGAVMVLAKVNDGLKGIGQAHADRTNAAIVLSK